MDYSKLSDSTLLALRDNKPIDYSKLSDSELKALAGDVPKAPTSPVVSGVRKFAQGATAGFSDELAGVAEGAGRIFGVDGLGGPMKNISLNKDGGTLDPQILKQAYQLGRDHERQALTQDSKDNPVTSAVASTAGVIASPINKLAKGMSWAKGGATLGAIQGLGNSDSDSVAGQTVDTALGSALGAGFGYAGGKVATGVPRLLDRAKVSVANKLGQNLEFAEKPGADAVKAAAKTLGIDEATVPKAVLTDNPTFQKIESGLSQSSSFPARPVREQYNDFFKAIDNAKDKISDAKTSASKFSLGSQIQSDLADQVQAQRAPVSKMYNDMSPQLQKIPVDEGVVNTYFGALKRNPNFRTQQGRDFLADHQSMILDTPDLASLKEVRSTIRGSLPKTASDSDEARVNALADAVTSIRNASIREAERSAPKSMTKGYLNLLDNITTADAAHTSNIKDVNSVNALIGNKSVSSPGQFLKKLGEMSEEDLAKRAANLDTPSMQSLQKTYPSVFEKVRQAKVNAMMGSSTHPVSGFNDTTFLKQYDGMGQEMKDLVFTPDMQSHIDSLQTLKQNIPVKLGPSGTPEGKAIMGMFNPKQNVLDYGVKKVLDGAGKTPALPTTPEIPAKTIGALIHITPNSSMQPSSTVMPKVADNNLKGPDKWASDGFDKITQHDPADKFDKQKLLNDPKIKDLLIQASDLNPGTQAMDKVIAQIKAKAK